MNKALYLLVIFLAFVKLTYTQNNFENYKLAFEYIKKDTLFYIVKEELKNVDKKDLYVSNEIIKLIRLGFQNKIAEYEYNLKDKREIVLTGDSLVELDSKREFVSFNLDTLIGLNKKSESKKFVVFFSEIIDNQLRAEVIYNYFDFLLPTYNQANANAITSVWYYFYLDDNNNIIKVFDQVVNF